MATGSSVSPYRDPKHLRPDLSSKRNIVRIEDKSHMSGDYERDDRIPPFKVNKDPSILLNNEDTPWLRDDHNQGSYVKKKFTIVPHDSGL